MNAWVSPILAWLATVQRMVWQKSTDLPSHRRDQLLKCADRAAQEAVTVARKFRTDLPHALRESALIAALKRQIRKARQLLNESLAVAERQGARHEYAQTLLARGRVGHQNSWPEAGQDLSTARQLLRTLGAEFGLDDAAEA